MKIPWYFQKSLWLSPCECQRPTINYVPEYRFNSKGQVKNSTAGWSGEMMETPWTGSGDVRYLRCSEPLWSQELSTGGGNGVEMVEVEMSVIMFSASFRAAWVRSTSSLRRACSGDSSIREYWSPEEYNWASNSEWINSSTYGWRT